MSQKVRRKKNIIIIIMFHLNCTFFRNGGKQINFLKKRGRLGMRENLLKPGIDLTFPYMLAPLWSGTVWFFSSVLILFQYTGLRNISIPLQCTEQFYPCVGGRYDSIRSCNQGLQFGHDLWLGGGTKEGLELWDPILIGLLVRTRTGISDQDWYLGLELVSRTRTGIQDQDWYLGL